MRYRFVVRVVSPIQNTKEAEDEVVTAALAVVDAVDRDPQFAGVLVSGLAQSPDGQTGWLMLGGVKCRVVDVFVDALNKTAYGA
jgi:putative intracellular protease/amidase